ncbi:MAG: S8 family serine peptidase [Betaproteobacteria bacterium]
MKVPAFVSTMSVALSIGIGGLFACHPLPADAQAKQRIERAADLPLFTYPMSVKLEQVVRDDKEFGRFAQAFRRDAAGVLARYDIADKSAERQLRGVLMLLDMLEERYDEALIGAEQIRALQEKPADKLLSGMQVRAMVGAVRSVGNMTSDAYRSAVATRMRAELDGMPFDVIANDVKSSKSRAETIGETLLLGRVREVLQPTVDKTGALSSELAPGLISARYGVLLNLPLKAPLVSMYTQYLAAHRVDKPDIWAARDVQLDASRKGTEVRIAVWDSGSDTTLFPGRVVLDGGKPAVVAFNRYGDPDVGELRSLAPTLKAKLPQMLSRTKGLSDLQSNIDSPEASEVKQYLSSLPAADYKTALEELRLASSYSHGTHVAGIAMAGNPFARLLVARIEFQSTLLPEPCPTKELSEKNSRASQAYVDFLKRQNVRVVNMSWGGSVKGFEGALELCGTGKSADERKAIARAMFDEQKAALTRAYASAPDILFVTSAGNSNESATFAEAIPSSIALPNLITVGAVDKAGDEAAFTSYGPTVVVHANGYQVDSFVPGGNRVALSGTSMSAPQVANLAAKILAIKPALKPVDVIRIIRDTAEKTADGRRILIHPARALAAAETPG